MPRVTKSFKPKEDINQNPDENTGNFSADQLVGEPRNDSAQPKEEIGNRRYEPSSNYDSRSSNSRNYEPRENSRYNRGGEGGYSNSGYERGGSRDYNRDNSRGNYERPQRDFPDRDVPTEKVSGVLDIMSEGHGFLRPKYIPSDRDVYISASQIRRFSLKPGDLVEGAARQPKENERYFGLLQVDTINGKDSEKFVGENGARVKRTKFEDLTAIYPNRLLKLETGKLPISQRIIDLVAPIGFGQRGMIVSPPKAGKTSILKDIAAGITKNHPDVILMAVLVGERPEEVTDFTRSIKGDVIASNFDEPAENQTTAAEVALERAKRLVEEGKDVVILLDSITRLGRAYNLTVPPSGRTLSGGFDPVALYPPKHFFGAARNCEEGGSLTIIATALVDTGSRMDDLIYEEFKGTGNMELHLDRRQAERRVFPAINISASGTRQEHLLYAEEDYRKITTMMRMINMLGEDERISIFIERLAKVESNDDFLKNLQDVK
jgi:transcription termination factor Rho